LSLSTPWPHTSARPAASRRRRLDRDEVRGAAPPQRIRILVADTSCVARAGIRLALEGHAFVICAEVDNASAAVEAAVREQPEVCLIDADLPGGGIATVSTIAAQLADTSVVLFADSLDERRLFAALQAGARGYLPRNIDLGRLAVTLRCAAEGEAVLPRKLASRVVEEFCWRERRRHLPLARDLTSREFEVFDLLRYGLTTAEIARRLVVERVTVRSHIASILKKLGAHDRAAAIRLFERR
jgi:DNA-binding NarL/FixJ family response regulator